MDSMQLMLMPFRDLLFYILGKWCLILNYIQMEHLKDGVVPLFRITK